MIWILLQKKKVWEKYKEKGEALRFGMKLQNQYINIYSAALRTVFPLNFVGSWFFKK